MDKCEKYREMISAMLDGELSEADRAALHAHMESCPECRGVYDAFAAVMGAEELEEPPEGMLSGAMFRIRNTAPAKKKKRIHWQRYAAAAACLALVLFGATRLDLNMGAESAAPADCAAPSSMEMYAMDTTAAEAVTQNAKGGIPAEDALITADDAEAMPPVPMPEAPMTPAERGEAAETVQLRISDADGTLLFETADAAEMEQLTAMLTESGTGYNVLVEYANGTAKAFILAVNAEELETLLENLK